MTLSLYYNIAEYYIGNHSLYIHDKNDKLRLYTRNNSILFKNKALNFERK